MYIGIRHVGLYMAALLAGERGDRGKPIGFIWPIGPDHLVNECGSGNFDSIETILVVDQELKTGRSLNNIFKCLTSTNHGGKPRFPKLNTIWVAVLSAKVKANKPKIKEVDELYENDEGEYLMEFPKYNLPCFVAFTCKYSVKFKLKFSDEVFH